MFYIHVEQREPGHTNIGLSSSLLIADLAGLESGACDHVVECVSALKSKKPANFRSSKLSLLLQVSQSAVFSASVLFLLLSLFVLLI